MGTRRGGKGKMWRKEAELLDTRVEIYAKMATDYVMDIIIETALVGAVKMETKEVEDTVVSM